MICFRLRWTANSLVSATIVQKGKGHKLAAVQFWYRDEEGRRSIGKGKAETCIKEFYDEQGNEIH